MSETFVVSNPGMPIYHAPHVNLETTQAELKAFADRAAADLAAMRIAVPANTAIVQPGGARFTSIGAAMASITDASFDKRYAIYLGSGTFNERVVMKEYVMLSGSLDESNYPTTFVKQPASATNKGTIVAASNSSIQNLSVHSDATADNQYFVVAVDCFGVKPFAITNCDLYSDDHGFKTDSVVPLSIDFLQGHRPPSPSNVWTDFTDLYATGRSDVYPCAVVASDGGYLQMLHAELIAQGTNNSAGGATYSGANIVFMLCKITGKTWSLVIPYGDASMTARNCQLNGPVDPKVKVINTPGESDS